MNRDVLQVVRAMILTYKIGYKDWVYLVPVVQANLNHTALPSLGNRAPVELFTGLPRPTPLCEFYLPVKNKLQQIPQSEQIDDYLNRLRSSLQKMHEVVEDKRLKQRLLNKKRERGENLVNFHVGDYVLRSRTDEKRGNKLQVNWVGPYRVTRADSHSFRVEHLITGEEHDVHPSRLKMYADDSLNVTDELLEHVAAQGIILAVKELKGHKWNNATKDFDILVSWKGLQSIEDSYEPMQVLNKDIKILLKRYVDTAEDPRLTDHWKKIVRTAARRLHLLNQRRARSLVAALAAERNEVTPMEKPSGVTATTRMRYNLEVSSKQFSVLWMRTAKGTPVPRTKILSFL